MQHPVRATGSYGPSLTSYLPANSAFHAPAKRMCDRTLLGIRKFLPPRTDRGEGLFIA